MLSVLVSAASSVRASLLEARQAQQALLESLPSFFRDNIEHIYWWDLLEGSAQENKCENPKNYDGLEPRCFLHTHNNIMLLLLVAAVYFPSQEMHRKFNFAGSESLFILCYSFIHLKMTFPFLPIPSFLAAEKQ